MDNTVTNAVAAVAAATNTGTVFNNLDWVVIALFGLGMIATVWYSMLKKNESGKDYFLSGRDANWLQIGSSIYSSNIGSEHLVGLAGAGYSYFNKEWETDTSGLADPSIYTAAFSTQMSSSLDLGISNPSASYIGNHCRDGKKDIDETGVDCGGAVCNACY